MDLISVYFRPTVKIMFIYANNILIQVVVTSSSFFLIL